MTDIATTQALIENLIQTRHPKSKTVLWSGSLSRGEGDSHSDIDLIIVYETISNAYRETFKFEGRAFDTFVHSPATLDYFYHHIDIPEATPALLLMVEDGLPIPKSNEWSDRLKHEASALLSQGPKPLCDAELNFHRFMLTDILDDILAPKARPFKLASAARLYEWLGDFYLRAQGLWSSKGKYLFKVIKQADPTYAELFYHAFETFYRRDETAPLQALVEETLAPYGGLLWTDYRKDAPSDWKTDKS